VVQVRWTFEAVRCLEGIHAYISSDNPGAASNVVRGIYAKVQLLREHPRLGQRYEPIAVTCPRCVAAAGQAGQDVKKAAGTFLTPFSHLPHRDN
jgi:plasmid stabilization system protein ParE